MGNFHAVSGSAPCPICHRTGWCMVTNDGCVCLCHREPSQWPNKIGDGWFHRLRERVGGDVPTSTGRGNARPAEPVDIAAYFEKLPQGEIQDRMCRALEPRLGLPAEILRLLDWRWDRAAHGIAIPMRDPWGLVTGIRYRSFESGAKWAKSGSKDGLFFDPDFIPYEPDLLLVCEGPTDTAAAMACGFWTVGRSSCGTGRDLIREFMKSRRVKRLVIVADDDKPKTRPGGGTWRPGLDGAVRLGEQLKVSYGIALPPIGFKDLREWYGSGTLDAHALDQAVRNVRQRIAADPAYTDELLKLLTPNP